jgi:tyrosyl-tRNA synthetase
MGRQLQEAESQEPQVVMLSPLLVGTDGKEKMSQSLGNYISIVDSPNDIFGKTMSIPDDILKNWFELCTDLPLSEIDAILRENPNPRDAKRRLAKEIVALYHSPEDGENADEFFLRTFSQREQPVDAPEASIPEEAIAEGLISIPTLITALGLARSNGAAKDLIKSGAVSIGSEKVTDPAWRPQSEELKGKILRVGKHQFRKIV